MRANVRTNSAVFACRKNSTMMPFVAPLNLAGRIQQPDTSKELNTKNLSEMIKSVKQDGNIMPSKRSSGKRVATP